MSKNIISKKSFDFAVRTVNLYKHLTAEKKEYVLSKQLLRSEQVLERTFLKRNEVRAKRILMPNLILL